jgi:hypothetical protein
LGFKLKIIDFKLQVVEPCQVFKVIEFVKNTHFVWVCEKDLLIVISLLYGLE